MQLFEPQLFTGPFVIMIAVGHFQQKNLTRRASLEKGGGDRHRLTILTGVLSMILEFGPNLGPLPPLGTPHGTTFPAVYA